MLKTITIVDTKYYLGLLYWLHYFKLNLIIGILYVCDK